MTSQLFSFYGKLIAATALILCSCVALAQDTLHYVKAKEFIFLGKPKVTEQLFHRIDTKETKGMTKAVQGLSKNSAGISLISAMKSVLNDAGYTDNIIDAAYASPIFM